MKDKLILKALVCSAFMCSLSVGTMAADVSTDVKAGDTEQSSWMDRTDIGIGVQGYQKDSYHDYAMPNKQMTDNNLSYDTRFHYHNHNSKQKMNAKYFIETLQPIKKYGKNAKNYLKIISFMLYCISSKLKQKDGELCLKRYQQEFFRLL